MRLNVSKCKSMHFGGKSEVTVDFYMEDLCTGGRKIIEESKCERDQGVMIRMK